MIVHPRLSLPLTTAMHTPAEARLEHLEEWAHRDQDNDFGELTLGETVLSHLEEWGCGNRSGDDDPANLKSHSELSRTPLESPSDRAHPLWDREMDG